MRILFLSQLMPYPPDAGAKVRQYYNLRYLAQHHDVTLVAFSRPDDPPGAKPHLETFCKAVLTVPMERSRLRDGLSLVGSWLKGGSFIIRRDWVEDMAGLVRQELAKGRYDIVHADQLWMAQYALLAKDLPNPPLLVLDEHNACYQIFQRLALGERNSLKRLALEREWRALRRYEADACSSFDRVVTVTEEDREILKGMVEEAGNKVIREKVIWDERREGERFITIPICVDTEGVEVVKVVEGSLNVLHLGTMFWPPNVEGVLWFVREVWPRVQAELPEASFSVVGKNPPESISRLAAEGAGIEVAGYVPDPRTYLERAGAFVVPLFSAGGMRVKIVDGWRWGLPIISTTIGAEGIRCRDGENICIADDAEGFAAAVIAVLRDAELNSRLRTNGRRWVEEMYDWQRVYPAWEGVYSSSR